MSSRRHSAEGAGLTKVGSALVAVLLAVFVIGVALVPLLLPVHTRLVASAFDPQERTGLSESRSLELAEDVRRFVLDEGAALPETVDGREAFDADAVAHLADVREVLTFARGATGLAGGVLLLVAVVMIARKRQDMLASAMRACSWGLFAFVGLMIALSMFDFGEVFSRFHSLFFESGTWTFPESSLLIQLFPLGFWVTSGALWAFNMACGGAMLQWSASRLKTLSRAPWDTAA